MEGSSGIRMTNVNLCANRYIIHKLGNISDTGRKAHSYSWRAVDRLVNGKWIDG